MAERLTTISISGGCRFDPCLGQFFGLFLQLCTLAALISFSLFLRLYSFGLGWLLVIFFNDGLSEVF
ncbi:hypothetical protein V8C43DRAFT_288657 [Trichoderma afarasin]